MKHSIDVETGPYAKAMAEAVETCVHCGFCLPACPTYQELGQEADSPRGRIFLMKQVLENELEPEEVSEHVDQCLGCLACETACPSGVKYRDLISPYRATARNKRSFWEKIRDWLVSKTIPYPWRFRWALRLGQWTRWLSFLAPRALKPMTEMIPDKVPPSIKLDEKYPADCSDSQTKGRALLLAGCAQQVLAPQINLSTIRILNYCGVSVEVPSGQACCGALSWHNGNADQARQLATGNFEIFQGDFDRIVTNAAGCGSGMKEYELLFEGTAEKDKAAAIANKTTDVSVVLHELGFCERITNSGVSNVDAIRVAYHDACHLSHGQKVRSEPRQLLSSLPGVELCELPGTEICCGSAGSYNIEQPGIADDLGRRKAESVMETSADVLVTGNIGCIIQIRNHLKKLGSEIRVMHLVDFLAERIFSHKDN